MATRRRLPTRIVRDLSAELAALARPLVFGVATDGEILVAGRLREANLSDEKAGAAFPKSTLDKAHDWLVVRARETGPVRRLLVRAEWPNFSHVQPLADGILLVAARCRWRPEGPEQNAVVIDEAGAVVRRFTLGDGIEDVRTTPTGAIWASYFDEGVFGNYGWGGPGPAPIGAPGLVRFDDHGELREVYDDEKAGTDGICDAYAVNVNLSETVHVYFYTDFPIVRLREATYARWSCGLAGARALAIRGDRAILVGGYAEPSMGRIVELRSDGNGALVEECSVTTPEGTPIAAMRPAGVGAELFFFDGARVLQLERW